MHVSLNNIYLRIEVIFYDETCKIFDTVFVHVLLHLIIFDELGHVRISTSPVGN
jgi:hypothetical protein